MDPSDVGNLGAVALVLLVLGKEALKHLLAKNDKDSYHESNTLRDVDMRLQHIQNEVENLRADLGDYIMKFHSIDLRLQMQEKELWRLANQTERILNKTRGDS